MRREFELHYDGKRFEHHRMPVDVLSDLPAFRALLLAFAKDEWRKRHPGKKRVPKNFQGKFSLSLFALKEGSAIPVTEWIPAIGEQTSLFGDETLEILDQAYSDLLGLLGNGLSSGARIDAAKLLGIANFGANLLDDEVITLSDHTTKQKILWDKARRAKLLAQLQEEQSVPYKSEGELVGTLSPSGPEARCLIHVQTDEFRTIAIPVDKLQIYEEFAPSLNRMVEFELRVWIDSRGKFKGVQDVISVSVVPDEALSTALERLEELKKLQKGWLDGEGEPLSVKATALAESFVKVTRNFAHLYRIFPTEEGGVLIDLNRNGWLYSVEFGGDDEIEMRGSDIKGEEWMETSEFPDVDSLIEFFNEKVGTDA